MNYDFLVFDLDGTISDPIQGFVFSMNAALDAYGYAPLEAASAGDFIGPPLDQSFRRITGSREKDHIQALVEKYREAYACEGVAGNQLYPGMAPALETLSRQQAQLAVCTSKRVDFAESILERLGVRKHFCFVDGGDVGITKWEQLRNLLANQALAPNAVMIGDRAVDLDAARRNGLSCAGVLWGYGSRAELVRENPDHLIEEPAQLLELVPFPGKKSAH